MSFFSCPHPPAPSLCLGSLPVLQVRLFWSAPAGDLCSGREGQRCGGRWCPACPGGPGSSPRCRRQRRERAWGGFPCTAARGPPGGTSARLRGAAAAPAPLRARGRAPLPALPCPAVTAGGPGPAAAQTQPYLRHGAAAGLRGSPARVGAERCPAETKAPGKVQPRPPRPRRQRRRLRCCCAARPRPAAGEPPGEGSPQLGLPEPYREEEEDGGRGSSCAVGRREAALRAWTELSAAACLASPPRPSVPPFSPPPPASPRRRRLRARMVCERSWGGKLWSPDASGAARQSAAAPAGTCRRPPPGAAALRGGGRPRCPRPPRRRALRPRLRAGGRRARPHAGPGLGRAGGRREPGGGRAVLSRRLSGRGAGRRRGVPGAMGYCSGRCTLVAVCGAQLVSGGGGGPRRRGGRREGGREGRKEGGGGGAAPPLPGVGARGGAGWEGSARALGEEGTGGPGWGSAGWEIGAVLQVVWRGLCRGGCGGRTAEFINSGSSPKRWVKLVPGFLWLALCKAETRVRGDAQLANSLPYRCVSLWSCHAWAVLQMCIFFFFQTCCPVYFNTVSFCCYRTQPYIYVYLWRRHVAALVSSATSETRLSLKSRHWDTITKKLPKNRSA